MAGGPARLRPQVAHRQPLVLQKSEAPGLRPADIEARWRRGDGRPADDAAVDEAETGIAHDASDSLRRRRGDRVAIHIEPFLRGDRTGGHGAGEYRRLGRRQDGEDNVGGIDDCVQIAAVADTGLMGEGARPFAPAGEAGDDAAAAVDSNAGDRMAHIAGAEHGDGRPAGHGSVAGGFRFTPESRLFDPGPDPRLAGQRDAPIAAGCAACRCRAGPRCCSSRSCPWSHRRAGRSPRNSRRPAAGP